MSPATLEMSMKTHLILASATVLALAACGSTAPEETAAADNMAMDNMAMDPMAGNEMAMNGADPMMANGMAGDGMAMAALPTAEFVNAAAASDMFEIESSKLAQTKSKDAKIKAFAAMIVADHTKSTSDLVAAAAKATPALTPAPTMTAEQSANLAALNSAGEADFDRTYISQQVPAHEKALAMLKGYAAGGDAPAIKEFAAATSGPVAKHLEEARSMQR